MIDFTETLPVLMELQTLGDKLLQQVAYCLVTNSITQMNQEHKNDDPKNKALQMILFEMLQQEKNEAKAERALITLCDLHQKKVWSDDTTADAICMACLHPSSRVMIAALSFLLDFEEIDDDDNDSDDSDEIEEEDNDDASDDSDEIEEEDDDDASDDPDNKDDQATPESKILLNMVSHKGTTSSKKNKAKLQYVSPSMKQQQHLSSEKSNTNYCSPLNHLKDAEVFCKNLFSRLQSSSNESFEVRMMMIGVIAQTVGLKKVILLDFYSYLEKYAKPDKRHVTAVLAAAVQACHKEVPRLAVEPLFNQIKYKFVEHERRREVITVGMNAVREMHHRMPELMIDANESKDKKREFSDLNAANISLGAMKKLMRKPIKFISITYPETYVVDKGHYASICMLHNRSGWLTKEQELACDRNEYFTEHLPGIGTLRHRWVRLPYTQEGQKQPAASEATIARTRQEKNASEATIARTCQEKNKKRKHSGKQFLGRKAT